MIPFAACTTSDAVRINVLQQQLLLVVRIHFFQAGG
jgi:hypothetical protein